MAGQAAGAAVRGPRGAVDLLGAGAGEDVADHGGVGEPGADRPGEGGVAAGAAADDECDLAGAGRVPADRARGPHASACGPRVSAVRDVLASGHPVVGHCFQAKWYTVLMLPSVESMVM